MVSFRCLWQVVASGSLIKHQPGRSLKMSSAADFIKVVALTNIKWVVQNQEESCESKNPDRKFCIKTEALIPAWGPSLLHTIQSPFPQWWEPIHNPTATGWKMFCGICVCLNIQDALPWLRGVSHQLPWLSLELDDFSGPAMKYRVLSRVFVE